MNMHLECPGGQPRNYSISLIRLISLIFIVTCHIQQYLYIELAWWFNVGVQIFLCISGFLYGQKDVGEVTEFYKKRFKKILIPYYIAFISYGVIQYIFARNVFYNRAFLLGLIAGHSQIEGGGHLWFIRYILLCYILTPLLQAYRKIINDKISMWLFAIVSVSACSIWFYCFNSFFTAAWMSCYMIGYSLGINEKEGYVNNSLLLPLIGVIAIAGNGIQIYCNYFAHISFKGCNYFYEYNHTFLGVFLFMLFKIIFDKKHFTEKCRGILDITDKYS